MAVQSITGLIAMLGEHHLLRPDQFQETQRLRLRFAEPKEALVESGWLTDQVMFLLQGHASRLVRGP